MKIIEAIESRALLNARNYRRANNSSVCAFCSRGGANGTISIGIFQKYNDNGIIKDVDKDAGGGVTQNIDQGIMFQSRKGGDQFVSISGNENTKLKDTKGNPLVDKAADILAHELVGHVIPHILGSDTGNAVENENKVRAEVKSKNSKKPSPLRKAEPNHIE